ncbi:SatD family protein [Fulvivirga sedimenti]|uniref:SatD family protein n=1 Tax=Fulvivirga sedimenti TaxID=2879465 RepID=A0A9X1HPW7_9BACT|nr:SatD family protein [Fulvivirga sedimenti]MCA6074609.1 SatD family protein [Fulvivirga sedimenti]MCA6075786.1 SatD family protein [Fulvivirga sedimenti]MCA6076914.1 SatD family protein [Fulvivirga sedimenti]
MNYLIMMADIIGSSREEGAALMNAFSGIVEAANKKFESGILSPLTITLGDEFQGIISDVQTATEIIFFIDEQCLIADPVFRLRYVLHYGEIQTPVNTIESYGMLGPGLTRTRELLGEIKNGDLEIVVSGLSAPNSKRLELAFRLYRAFYNDWHEKDLSVASDFIKHQDYKILSSMYGKDPSTMWRKEKTLKMKDFYASRELITLMASDA